MHNVRAYACLLRQLLISEDKNEKTPSLVLIGTARISNYTRSFM
jgi:hypothetical protein